MSIAGLAYKVTSTYGEYLEQCKRINDLDELRKIHDQVFALQAKAKKFPRTEILLLNQEAGTGGTALEHDRSLDLMLQAVSDRADRLESYQRRQQKRDSKAKEKTKNAIRQFNLSPTDSTTKVVSTDPLPQGPTLLSDVVFPSISKSHAGSEPLQVQPISASTSHAASAHGEVQLNSASTSHAASTHGEVQRISAREEKDTFQIPKKVCRPKSPIISEVATRNSFERLEEVTMDTSIQVDRSKKPPPLFIDAPADPSLLLRSLSDLNGEDLTATFVVGKLKTRAKDDKAHEAILAYLKENQLGFHTFSPKGKKPVKYILKRIPAVTKPEAITEALASLGHRPQKVSLLFKQEERRTQPPFVLAMDPSGEHAKIMEVKRLLFYRVIIERLRRRKGPVLCYRCLQSGHTSHQCFRRDACPRCGSDHNISDCKRNAEEPPICNRCNISGHSGRDRNCPKLTAKSKTVAPMRHIPHPRTTPKEKISLSSPISYARAASGLPATEKESPLQQIQPGTHFNMDAVTVFLAAHAKLKSLPEGPDRLEATLDSFAALFAVFI